MIQRRTSTTLCMFCFVLHNQILNSSYIHAHASLTYALTTTPAASLRAWIKHMSNHAVTVDNNNAGKDVTHESEQGHHSSTDAASTMAAMKTGDGVRSTHHASNLTAKCVCSRAALQFAQHRIVGITSRQVQQQAPRPHLLYQSGVNQATHHDQHTSSKYNTGPRCNHGAVDRHMHWQCRVCMHKGMTAAESQSAVFVS